MKKFSIALLILVSSGISSGQNWQIPEGSMLTRWTENINIENVLPEYPRPNLQRKEWLNLNGLWDYAITSKDDHEPAEFDGKILVPFPVESSLSGVQKSITEKERLWYRRSFNIPGKWSGKRILLNFGAVDWETKVWLNNKLIGSHKGGYDSFSFDITEFIVPDKEQIITISVWDPTEKGHQPRGKQTTDTHGFWYTAVTGIWQTVWIESVEKNLGYIKSIKTETDIDSKIITILTEIAYQSKSQYLNVRVKDGSRVVSKIEKAAIKEIKLLIPEPKLWSPQNPFLYDVEIDLMNQDEIVDSIKSYFGMRKVSKKKDENGILRLALNNEILFQFGLLDQGWWPDGLYRAPTDGALKYDIEVAKSLGFNVLRKHGKMEPERWYYWCDKLGMLVWQDMTPGDIDGEYGTDRNEESKKQFEVEYEQMIAQLYNHPSIVKWVIFNEGWGQYETERLVDWTKKLDPYRLVIGASGFMDKGVGDILDVHGYPGPTGAALEKNRVTTLGEFGGLGFPVKGNLWDESKAWGYVSYKNRDELVLAYEELMENLKPYISEGISAAIYTQ
ncbi:MAG: glycoside hydrolase family 2 TIM barrel-domain containing protein, partial [Melioribacteraceae bacterium]|nr:glycoside hydrolase family 2 TIM barrel-domain containing protein [Melioribacteraceae bacterium]